MFSFEVLMIIEDAILSAGGAVVVAEKLKINPVSVYEWIANDRLPAKRVLAVAELGSWAYTPHQLDATLYPNPADGLPPEVAAAMGLP